MRDSRQEGSPLTGSGHDISNLLGVVEAVGVAPEGTQLIASGLSIFFFLFLFVVNVCHHYVYLLIYSE